LKLEKENEMKLTGPGVYLMGWESASLRPGEALGAISRGLGSYSSRERIKALEIFIGISVIHGAWCGVNWLKLVEMMHRKYKNKRDFMIIKAAFKGMIRDGLLEVSRPFKVWRLRWLNWFFPQIICPTELLLREIRPNR